MKNFLSSRIFQLIWSLALCILVYYLCPAHAGREALLIVLILLWILFNLGEYRVHATRCVVGGLFVFSGFIKANDPLGFSYKLKEYFEVFQADTGMAFFETFAHIALPLAIIICASEIILGVMLLIGYRRNLTLWLLLAQIVFFTFLTFYSAYYNKVTHCGCFGDFLKLKPWESFWKDIALVGMIAMLFAERHRIGPVFRPMIVSTLFLLGLIFSIAFPIYTYRNLPIFDFRAYAPGENIRKNMEKGEGYVDAKYESVLVYENLKTGEKKEFSQKVYMESKIWEDTLNWKWSATDNKLISDAVNPPKITDFSVNNQNGENITDSLLSDPDYSFWIIMHELKGTNEDASTIAKMNDLYTLATKEGHNVIALTSSGSQDIDEFKHQHNALYDFAIADNTVLKTMIRSNPGLMLVRNGTVMANWHYNNWPSYSEVKDKYMK